MSGFSGHASSFCVVSPGLEREVRVATQILSPQNSVRFFRIVWLGSRGEWHQRIALGTRSLAVGLHAGLTRGLVCQLELLRYVVASAVVHLVRRLTPECRVGDPCVVLVDVVFDQRLQRADRIERVQVEPLVLEDSPPRLDEGVGERDLGLGQKSPQESGLDQFVDGSVEVLDTTVGEQGRLLVDQATGCAEKEFRGGARIERGRHFPCQDPA